MKVTIQQHWFRTAGVVFALAVAFLYYYAIGSFRRDEPLKFWLLAIGGLGFAWGGYWIFTASRRRRRSVLREPFPDAWRAILERSVGFYRRLDEEEQERFERWVQLFLAGKRVSGIGFEIDDKLRLLVAASAAIPVFGYPEWDYRQIEEVLVYPDAFGDNYEVEGPGRDLLGLMGEGELSRVIILSAPDLRSGFDRLAGGTHPGIHEFAHLFDAADGALDGIPQLGDPGDDWPALVSGEMDRIRRGYSRVDPYAATAPEEFFAVVSEFFFLRPEVLQADHPQLYGRLVRIFRQDPLQRRGAGRGRRGALQVRSIRRRRK